MAIDKPQCGGSTQVLLDATNALIDLTSNARKGATVSLFGDSFSFFQKDDTNDDSTLAASCWAYALAFLGDSVNVTNFSGVGGNNSSQMLARLQTDILDVKTDWVFAQVGVNDFYGFDFTAQQVFDNVTDMITQIITNGQKVVWLNCYPQNVARSGFTAAKSLDSANYNRMLSEWAQDKDGLILVDVYSRFVDNTDSTNGAAKANYIGTDNIHLSLYGSWVTGNLVVDAVSNFLKQESNAKRFSPLTTGDYGAVNFSNFNGNSGVLGTDASGIAPDDWILSRQNGEGTVVGAVVGDEYQMQITKSVAGTSSLFRLQSFNLSSEFSGGEEISFKLLLSFDTDALELEELRVYLFANNGVDPFFTTDWGRSFNGFTPISPMSIDNILIEINPAIIPSSPTDIRVYIDPRLKGAGTGAITLKNLRIENV